MVLTSGFNVKLEELLKMAEPIEIPMNNPPTPAEMECLGFRLCVLNDVFCSEN